MGLARQFYPLRNTMKINCNNINIQDVPNYISNIKKTYVSADCFMQEVIDI